MKNREVSVSIKVDEKGSDGAFKRLSERFQELGDVSDKALRQTSAKLEQQLTTAYIRGGDREVLETTRRFSSELRVLQEMAKQGSVSIDDYNRRMSLIPGFTTQAIIQAEKFGNILQKVAEEAEEGGSTLKEAFGEFLGNLSARGAALLIDSLKELGKEALNASLEVQQSVARISTLKDIDLGRANRQLFELSTRVPQSAQQLGEGLYNIFSSVEATQSQAVRLLEEFGKGAVAARTDTETFGTAVLGVINAYKMELSSASHISDVFFNTVKLGVVSGEELASNLGNVTQTAKNFGVSFDELGGLIAGVTKEGGQASVNINNLNNVLQKLPTEEAAAGFKDLQIELVNSSNGSFRPILDILDDLNKSLEGLSDKDRSDKLSKIFSDSEAATGLKTVLSQLNFIKDAVDENARAAGVAEEAYRRMSETAAFKGQLLYNTIISIGASFASVFTESKALGTVLGGLGSAIEFLAGHVGTIALLAAAFVALKVAMNAAAVVSALDAMVLGFKALGAQASGLISTLILLGKVMTNTVSLSSGVGATLVASLGGWAAVAAVVIAAAGALYYYATAEQKFEAASTSQVTALQKQIVALQKNSDWLKANMDAVELNAEGKKKYQSVINTLSASESRAVNGVRGEITDRQALSVILDRNLKAKQDELALQLRNAANGANQDLNKADAAGVRIDELKKQYEALQKLKEAGETTFVTGYDRFGEKRLGDITSQMEALDRAIGEVQNANKDALESAGAFTDRLIAIADAANMSGAEVVKFAHALPGNVAGQQRLAEEVDKAVAKIREQRQAALDAGKAIEFYKDRVQELKIAQENFDLTDEGIEKMQTMIRNRWADGAANGQNWNTLIRANSGALKGLNASLKQSSTSTEEYWAKVNKLPKDMRDAVIYAESLGKNIVGIGDKTKGSVGGVTTAVSQLKQETNELVKAERELAALRAGGGELFKVKERRAAVDEEKSILESTLRLRHQLADLESGDKRLLRLDLERGKLETNKNLLTQIYTSREELSVSENKAISTTRAGREAEIRDLQRIKSSREELIRISEEQLDAEAKLAVARRAAELPGAGAQVKADTAYFENVRRRRDAEEQLTADIINEIRKRSDFENNISRERGRIEAEVLRDDLAEQTKIREDFFRTFASRTVSLTGNISNDQIQKAVSGSATPASNPVVQALDKANGILQTIAANTGGKAGEPVGQGAAANAAANAATVKEGRLTLAQVKDIAKNEFGLIVSSGLRKNAVTVSGKRSYHADNMALDFDGSPAQMMKFAKAMAERYGEAFAELFYTPLGFSIKHGKQVAPIAAEGHYSHVHAAITEGRYRLPDAGAAAANDYRSAGGEPPPFADSAYGGIGLTVNDEPQNKIFDALAASVRAQNQLDENAKYLDKLRNYTGKDGKTFADFTRYDYAAVTEQGKREDDFLTETKMEDARLAVAKQKLGFLKEEQKTRAGQALSRRVEVEQVLAMDAAERDHYQYKQAALDQYQSKFASTNKYVLEAVQDARIQRTNAETATIRELIQLRQEDAEDFVSSEAFKTDALNRAEAARRRAARSLADENIQLQEQIAHVGENSAARYENAWLKATLEVKEANIRAVEEQIAAQVKIADQSVFHVEQVRAKVLSHLASQKSLTDSIADGIISAFDKAVSYLDKRLGKLGEIPILGDLAKFANQTLMSKMTRLALDTLFPGMADRMDRAKDPKLAEMKDQTKILREISANTSGRGAISQTPASSLPRMSGGFGIGSGGLGGAIGSIISVLGSLGVMNIGTGGGNLPSGAILNVSSASNGGNTSTRPRIVSGAPINDITAEVISGKGTLWSNIKTLFSTKEGGLFAPRKSVFGGESKMAGYIAGAGSIAQLLGGIIGGKAGNVLSMAGTGAQVGAMFGPWGAGIGAAAGAIYGLFSGGTRKQDEKARTEAYQAVLKEFDTMILQLRYVPPRMDSLDATIRATQLISEYNAAVSQLKDKKTRNIALAEVTSPSGIIYRKNQELQAAINAAQLNETMRRKNEGFVGEFAGGAFMSKDFAGQYGEFKRRNGFLPGAWTGRDTLPSLLAMGEMVLNPAQQRQVMINAGMNPFAAAGIPNYKPGAEPAVPKFAGGISFSAPALAPGGSTAKPVVDFKPNIKIVIEGNEITDARIKSIAVDGVIEYKNSNGRRSS